MKIALDKESKRYIDENGFLHVSISNISKECVSPYYGYEIPNYKELKLDANSIYYAYRKGEELEKGAKSFNGLPLLRDHYIEHAENPQKEHRVGSLGTDAIFEKPYLKNSLIVTDAEAIRKIENKERVELSAAYAYTPLFEKGVFEGQEYDFIMTNIRGNHVALVEEGRVGKDVVVADSCTKSNVIMKEEKMQTKPTIQEDEEKTQTNLQEKQVMSEESQEHQASQASQESQESMVNQEKENQPQKEAKLKKYRKKLESLKVEKELKEKLIKKLPNYIQSIRVLNELLKSLMAIDEVLTSKNECDECKKDEENQIDNENQLDKILDENELVDELDDELDDEIEEELEESEEDKNDEDDEDELKKAIKAMDSTSNLYEGMRSKLKLELKAELQEVQQAINECTPLVGTLDLFAFDTAKAVYLQACNLLELKASGESAQDVILAYQQNNMQKNSVQNTGEERVFQSRFQ